MKNPEEVKTALECCFQYNDCTGCPYFSPNAPLATCIQQMGVDALLNITQLEALVKKGEKKVDQD